MPRAATLLVVCASLILLGGWLLFPPGNVIQAQKQLEPSGSCAEDPKAAKEAELKTLAEARVEVSKKACASKLTAFGEIKKGAGNAIFFVVNPNEVYLASVQLLTARRDLSNKKEDQIAALEDHLKQMKELQKKARPLTPSLLPQLEYDSVLGYLLEAEYWLAKEKSKLPQPGNVIQAQKQPGQPFPSAEDPKTTKETDLKTLAEARVEETKKACTRKLAAFGEIRRLAGNVNLLVVSPNEVYLASVQLLSAQRDLSSKKEDQLAALEDHLKRMKELEKKAGELTPVLLPQFESDSVKGYRLEAEYWLAKEKSK